jgi:hypothetical protein
MSHGASNDNDEEEDDDYSVIRAHESTDRKIPSLKNQVTYTSISQTTG